MPQEAYADLFSRHFSFWAHLSAAEMHYPKGHNVHSGTANCVGVLFIKKGQLRTYLLSEDGRDVTLYRLFAGDVCILSASCVLQAITFDVFIDAEEDTDVSTAASVLIYLPK